MNVSTNEVISYSVGLGLFLSFGCVCLSLWYGQQRARMKHAERMKALETGRELPERSPTAPIKVAARPPVGEGDPAAVGPHAFAAKCFSAAFWLGFWGFLIASPSGSIMAYPAGSVAISIAIAAATGASVVTALICGTVLACRPAPRPIVGVEKPHYAHAEV